MSALIGTGYDSHRFGGDGPLRLGGVDIEFDRGLQGHSDGDALLHAICDALLGAAGLPDIGSHFPDTDQAWKGADSRLLLEETAKALQKVNLRPVNVDATLIAERPKMAPHIPAMKKNIAGILGLPEARVGIKAKTNEGMGFVGRGEGIAVLAVASLAEAAPPEG